MTLVKHSALTCDGCGDIFYCGYEEARDTRNNAWYQENWAYEKTTLPNGNVFYRDLCHSCVVRGF